MLLPIGVFTLPATASSLLPILTGFSYFTESSINNENRPIFILREVEEERTGKIR